LGLWKKVHQENSTYIGTGWTYVMQMGRCKDKVNAPDPTNGLLQSEVNVEDSNGTVNLKRAVSEENPREY
jgi:hypothetical protein